MGGGGLATRDTEPYIREVSAMALFSTTLSWFFLTHVEHFSCPISPLWHSTWTHELLTEQRKLNSDCSIPWQFISVQTFQCNKDLRVWLSVVDLNIQRSPFASFISRPVESGVASFLRQALWLTSAELRGVELGCLMFEIVGHVRAHELDVYPAVLFMMNAKVVNDGFTMMA